MVVYLQTGRSFDSAVGGSSEHTWSNTGDGSFYYRNRATTEKIAPRRIIGYIF